MLERDIEAYFVKKVKDAGGVAMKFTSPQRRSVPDRIVLMPGEEQRPRRERQHARPSDKGGAAPPPRRTPAWRPAAKTAQAPARPPAA